MAGVVGDRTGTIELLRGGMGAGVRRSLNNGLQPLLRLGEHNKARKRRSDGDQKDWSCHFHGMFDYFFSSSVNGLVSTWNGLKILTPPVNGR
jgi:hypothetical protein